MKELREELRKALSNLTPRRPPVIRRSNSAEFLFASDLPQLISKELLTLFIRRIKNNGWTVSVTDENWIELDKAPTCHDSGIITGLEAACCVSLLEKHPGNADCVSVKRRITKARDANKLEECCRKLHREWSESLRLGRELPKIEKAFFSDVCD